VERVALVDLRRLGFPIHFRRGNVQDPLHAGSLCQKQDVHRALDVDSEEALRDVVGGRNVCVSDAVKEVFDVRPRRGVEELPFIEDVARDDRNLPLQVVKVRAAAVEEVVVHRDVCTGVEELPDESGPHKAGPPGHHDVPAVIAREIQGRSLLSRQPQFALSTFRLTRSAAVHPFRNPPRCGFDSRPIRPETNGLAGTLSGRATSYRTVARTSAWAGAEPMFRN